jgi:hypothetical protein
MHIYVWMLAVYSFLGYIISGKSKEGYCCNINSRKYLQLLIEYRRNTAIRDGVRATSDEINTAQDLLGSILKSVGLLLDIDTIPVPTRCLIGNDVRVRKISFNAATSGVNENLAPDPILLVLKSADKYLRMKGIKLFTGARKSADSSACSETEGDQCSMTTAFTTIDLNEDLTGQIGDGSRDVTSFRPRIHHDTRQHHSKESPPMTEIVIIRRDENFVNGIGSSRTWDKTDPSV